MSKIKIMIDPGHGGRDPGAVANGLVEKDLTLTIAREIREVLLRNYDVLIRMTRDSDMFVSLEDRARLANSWGADYFISVHINAGGGTGFESFIHPHAAKHTGQFQACIHQGILGKIKARDRGRKTANYAVLRLTKMAAVLTESYFIDHVEDSKKLKELSVIKAIATGHVVGLQELLNLRLINESLTPRPRLVKVYRLLVDGVQIGAYGERENVMAQVEQFLDSAKKIEVERVE
ncbi:N-acetylmuramoyl-L-alanine amidase family protein [Alkalihalophilus marmarensis]|uniref:N-acetylmuramoyl-L-alanine amidase n=1 Tax=Alkalihalophilus marmarensis DSM 21297 TaxID=1188261 RepID=U6SPT7_9BACI|nr:N-acetylmuramoyl-L-alanine amidase [Alkalihalophilus marmarensis]ERN53744.1 N-acetylmuramoyl-L-alanine amidase [Alkalihalophilus marmarensis DSM 21297]